MSTKTHKISGLFLSMHGFTKAPVDLTWVTVVEGRSDLGELLTRKSRHAAETGCPLLTATQILTFSAMGYTS